MDYEIEDIIKNSEKKKKLNSGDKGKRGERDLVKILNSRFPEHNFARSVGSGNRWSQTNLTEEAKQFFSSDIVTPSSFIFTIESKYGYASIDLCNAMLKGHKELDEFLKQVQKDADRVQKKPLLCWRKPRMLWLAFLKTLDFPTEKGFDYELKYKDWTCISLDELLKLNDTFFFIKPL